MLKSIQSRASHVSFLWKAGIWGKWIGVAWGVIYAGWAAWRSEFVKSADSDHYRLPTMIAHISPLWGIVIAALILTGWVFEASYKATLPLRDRIRELEKVDRWDLQNMLGGMFMGDTYMYPTGMVWVKNYNGNFELERLKDDFDMLTVRAPRHSWVNLNFQFLNSRQDQKDYAFYLLDGAGKVRAIDDIYGRIGVFLDDQARFGLKLVTDENYEIADAASLLVTVETWAK